MGGLAEASSRSRGGPLPSIFLDQTEDNSAKKILFWIELLHTLRSGWVVPPRHLKLVKSQSFYRLIWEKNPFPPFIKYKKTIVLKKTLIINK